MTQYPNRKIYVAIGRVVIVDYEDGFSMWEVWSNYRRGRYSIVSATNGLRELM
jgi:hypothetical protein